VVRADDPRAEQLYEIYLKERAAEEAASDQLHQVGPRRLHRARRRTQEAERRRKTLMARQSGQRLAEERKRRGLTQAQLAQTMGVSPGRVSQIERGELSTIEAIARYVQALGGRLDLVANFTDRTLTVTTTEAA
jgi:ribosome-binding protein aMBF1 (putative translation factor)